MTIKTPSGLRPRGRRFWRFATSTFDFSEAEQELLGETCRTMDLLDDLDAQIRETGLQVTGSTGQPVANPLLVEVRGQRALLHRLINALQLPDLEGEVVPSAASARGRAAAQARWREKGLKRRGTA